jgi:Glycosyl transferase family 2
MRLVMTLLVRDEADIVDAQIAYHLRAGVDFVIATDNASRDGTLEVLEKHAAAGHLRLLREDADNMHQGDWVTRMARLAAEEHDADWVINSDADEFWCSHGTPIKEVLAQVPRRFATVRALMRNFVPRPGEEFFAERMTARLVPAAATVPRHRVHPFHAQDKVIHRAHRDVTVGEGNHEARWDSSIDLRGAWPFEILHFPMRSAAQCVHKWRNYERHGYAGYDVLTDFDACEYYESILVDDDALAAGVGRGTYVIDTRLRDALRKGALSLPSLSLSEEAALAADAEAASSRDALTKIEGRLRELETRVAAVEHAAVTRLTSRRRRPRSRR